MTKNIAVAATLFRCRTDRKRIEHAVGGSDARVLPELSVKSNVMNLGGPGSNDPTGLRSTASALVHARDAGMRSAARDYLAATDQDNRNAAFDSMVSACPATPTTSAP